VRIRFKAKILSELKGSGIEVYRFPTNDETVAEQNTRLNSSIPFAVVASTDFVKNNKGKSVRARQYPWGIVEVENEEHCDFVALREALLRVNVEDLRMRTHGPLYESYRRERLRSMGVGDAGTGPRMMQQICDKRDELHAEFERRQKEQKDAFVKRVLAREAQLNKEKDEMVNRYSNTMNALQKELAQLDAEGRQALDDETRMLAQMTQGAGKKGKK